MAQVPGEGGVAVGVVDDLADVVDRSDAALVSLTSRGQWREPAG
jgi:hypothetical protein